MSDKPRDEMVEENARLEAEHADEVTAGEIRPMTYAAVRASIARDARIRAENAGKGYRCDLCADTGVVPAPEPYGSWGCTWKCLCQVQPGAPRL